MTSLLQDGVPNHPIATRIGSGAAKVSEAQDGEVRGRMMLVHKANARELLGPRFVAVLQG